jgi:hypothetical protein
MLQLTHRDYFKLFDAKVLPILLYGSEIWGHKQYEDIERVHITACKKCVGVGMKAVNCAVLGDCGRHPICAQTKKRVTKYWCRILSLPDEKWVKKCYNMQYLYSNLGKQNWASHVKNILFFVYGIIRE